MKNVSRRDFLKAAAITTAGSALVACAPQATPTPQVIEVTKIVEGESKTVVITATPEPVTSAPVKEGEIRALVLKGPPVEPVQEFMIAAFQAKYPKVKVNLEYDGAGDAAKYAALAAAGTMADVFFSADLWVVPFAKNSISLDLKPLAEADAEMDLNDIFPSMLGLGTFGGEIHMLPSSLDVVTMYYNIDLFEKAKAELPTDSWTWDDLVANCKKITDMEKDDAGLPKYWGLSHASSGVWSWWAAYYPWVVGYGGKILDGKKSTWSDPNTIAAIKGYTELWTKHNVAQPLGNDVGGEAFRMGRAAIYTHIPGVRSGVRTDVGDKFKWDVQVMPKMPDGKHRTGMGAWGMSAYSGSKDKELAYDYVKQLVSPSLQMIMAKKEMGTPLVKSVAADPSWKAGLPTPPTNVDAFIKGADDAVLPVMDYPADCGSFYAGELNASITNALESIIRGKMSVEEAMAGIDKTTQACLDKAS
jgi:multiple sugar transport system substrate-binding protein